MDRILLRHVVVQTVEHVLQVSFVVQYREFPGVQETPLFKAFSAMKFPHLWPPYARLKPNIGGAKTP